MFFTKSLSRTAKWLCLTASALALTLGSSIPTQAGVIPWVYNAIFGRLVTVLCSAARCTAHPTTEVGSLRTVRPSAVDARPARVACLTWRLRGRLRHVSVDLRLRRGRVRFVRRGQCPGGRLCDGNCGVSYYAPMASACTPNAPAGGLSPTPAAAAVRGPERRLRAASLAAVFLAPRRGRVSERPLRERLALVPLRG